MDLLLVIPPSPERRKIVRMIDCSHETKANYLWQPNDFMIISSRMEPDDRLSLLDGTVDSLTEKDFLERLEKLSADLVVFALSSVCWESDYGFFLQTKNYFPSVPLFVIGDIFLEEEYKAFILKQCDGIVMNPYVIDLREMAGIKDGEAHSGLRGICTAVGQDVFPNGKRPAHVKGGIPRHEVFLKRGYRFPFARRFRFATVTTMWGCPFSCSYCTDSRFPPLVRSSEDVLGELAYIAGLGIKELFMADKAFGFSRSTAFPLLDGMRRDFSFSWSCYFHPQLYDERLLDMMRAAGCHTIIIGIDSADVPSLKRFNRMVDARRIEQLIGHANRIKMSICADFILGLEGESEEDVIRTIEYALHQPIDFASFNIAAPLPGSDIRKKAVTSLKLAFGREGFDTSGRGGIIGSELISVETIKRLRRQAFRKFYLRPSCWMRRLRKTASPEHLLIQVLEMASMLMKYSS